MRSMCIAHLICGLKSTSSRSMRRYAFASHPASDHQNQRKLMCRLLEIYQVLTLFVFIISPWSMRIFLRGNLRQEKARVTIAIINNKCCKSLMTFLWVSEGLLKFLWTAFLYDLQNTNLPKLLIVFHYYSLFLCLLWVTVLPVFYSALKGLFERFLQMTIHKYFWTILIKFYIKLPW